MVNDGNRELDKTISIILNSTFSDTSSTYLEYPTDVAIADIDHNMYALVSNYAGSSSGIQMLTLTDNPDIYPPSILDLPYLLIT